MDYSVSEVELRSKVDQLNLHLSDGISFIPENIDTVENVDEFLFTDTLTELKKVFRLANIEVSSLGNVKGKLHARKSADIYLPALFFGLATLSNDPNVVSIALNLVSSYVYDFFKGSAGKKTVSIEIYVEKTKKKDITKISYNGTPEGILALEKVIIKLTR